MNRFYTEEDTNAAVIWDSKTGKCVWSKRHHYQGWIEDAKNGKGRAIDQAEAEADRLNKTLNEAKQ